MKTFSQFITEAKEARPPKEVLRKIDRAYGRKYPETNVDVSHDDKSGDLRVNQLFVPPNMQGKGIGTRVMKGLTKYADKQKKRMTLTQDPDKGKKAKLAKFYKSHGFEKNRGRSRDFTTRDTDIRNPKLDEAYVDFLKGSLTVPSRVKGNKKTESPYERAGRSQFRKMADAQTTRGTQAVRGPRGKKARLAAKQQEVIQQVTQKYHNK